MSRLATAARGAPLILYLGTSALVKLWPEVARNARELADRHALRGFDVIHLTSVLWFKFAAYDKRLRTGVVHGLPVYPGLLKRARK